MRCADAHTMIGAVLAGDATDAQTARLEEHLASCGECARQWGALGRFAASVRRATPPALGGHRDVVADAMARIAYTPPRSSRRVRWLARAAAAAIMIAAALWLTTRPPGKRALLAQVEAALAIEPSYRVWSRYDSSGKLASRSEVWQLADGGRYQRNLVGAPGLAMRTCPGAHVWWRRDADGKYEVGWHGGNDVDASWRDFIQRAEESAEQAGISPQVGGETRFLLGVALANSDELAEATETWGELDGRRTRVIHLRTRSTIPVERIRQWHDVDVTLYLDPATDRALRITTSLAGPRETEPYTTDEYPIRYDIEPPASLSMTIPEGTVAAMYGGTYSGDMVDPVWEHMSEEDRAGIAQTVQAALGAWSRGDWDEFQRHWDFAGILDYGVKGKFTPEEFREQWQSQVEQQRGRWEDTDVRVDYAVATAQPPRMALEYWSIEREGLPAGEGWVKYRDEPTTEPGLAVFASLSGTEAGGEVHTPGTVVFLKRIGGEYKLILWQPPF